jgi:rhamnosyltransferase
MAAPVCSVIIRSFNEEKHIGKLLEGIRKQSVFHQLEIIVVDSGSTDSTVEIARQYDAKIVTIKSEEFSFGRALNKGCAAATGKYLLFASAHVYPLYTDWIEKLLAAFKDDKVALVYGRQVGNEASKYSEQQLFKKWFPDFSNYDQVITFCNNANCMVRSELWETQRYDELVTGLEDLDWAKKIKSRGYKIAYEASAAIVHVHEETPARIKNRYRREAMALKVIYPGERFSFFTFLRLTVGNIFSDVFHAVHDRKLTGNIFSIIVFRYMQFWGTYLGYSDNHQINETLRNRLYYPNVIKKNRNDERDSYHISNSGEKIVYNSGFER